MNVLLFVPLHPAKKVYGEVANRIQGLDTSGHRLDIHYEGEEHVNPNDQPFDQITAKYQHGRQLVLGGGYDAMMTVEFDNLIPTDALQRLAKIEADVAYGLYCCRRKFSRWLAFSNIWDAAGLSLTARPGDAEAAWGQVAETKGIGFGCTLIHRHVLEAIPFWRKPDHPASNDWQFALDVAAAGLRQMHDCGLIVGHIIGDNPRRVLWPDGQTPFYKLEGEEDVKGLTDNEPRTMYRCVSAIYSGRDNRYYFPGEPIPLTQDAASLLLARGKVEAMPAKFEESAAETTAPTITKRTSEGKEEDGTDD